MRLIEALKTAFRLLILDEKSMAIVMWKLRRGDSTLRLEYDLNSESLVFDVGGYRGEWALKLASRYDCNIHIFDPVDEYCREIGRQLGGNRKVVINNTGLSDRTEKHLISIDEAGSSVIKLDGKVTEIQLIDIDQYVSGLNIRRIDLIKINIEGGEYALLSRMHERDLIRSCVDIQIQFHDFVPDAPARRNELREILSATHDLTYDYPFIWENWHLRDSGN